MKKHFNVWECIGIFKVDSPSNFDLIWVGPGINPKIAFPCSPALKPSIYSDREFRANSNWTIFCIIYKTAQSRPLFIEFRSFLTTFFQKRVLNSEGFELGSFVYYYYYKNGRDVLGRWENRRTISKMNNLLFGSLAEAQNGSECRTQLQKFEVQ